MRYTGCTGVVFVCVVSLCCPGGMFAQDLVISEVLYDPAGINTGQQIVELRNDSAMPIDPGAEGLWLRFAPVGWQFPSGFSIPPGGHLQVHVNRSGSDTQTDVFTGTSGMRNLRAADTLALYSSDLFQDPAAILDFVQWGGAGLGGEDVAASAGIWTGGTFVDVSALRAGSTISYQGAGDTAADWCIDGSPTPGLPNDECTESFVRSFLALNEVGFTGDPGTLHPFVEVINSGNRLESLSGVAIVLNGKERYTFPPDTLLGPDEIAVVHLNIDGTDSEFALYSGQGTFADFGLIGAVSLHAGPQEADPTLFVDFVQWGAAGSALESVADAVDAWSAGDFIDVAELRPFGSAASVAGGVGLARWAVDNTPTAGLPNDAPPAFPRIVINEILLDPSGADTGNQVIELSNPHAAAVDPAGYMLCFRSRTGAERCLTIANGHEVPAGGFLLIRLNRSGIGSVGEIYTGPFEDLDPLGGELALFYYPNSDVPNHLADYVRWGAGPTLFETTASQVGIWPQGDAVDVSLLRDGASLAYDGEGDDGASYRVDVSPSIGEPNDTCCAELPFVRGDCNDDGGMDLTDAVFGLRYLFRGETEPRCLDACDVNDDSLLDLSDAIFGLSYLFRSGATPPAPSPDDDCQNDPTADTISCDSFLSCPEE